MRRAILATGPQGAGKTTFCKEVVQYRPEIVLVERDAVLEELFGQVCLDPYSGDHEYGEKIMWQRVEDVLSGNENIDMILDAWCGYSIDRTRYAQKLRALGVEVVDLWYFVTSEDVCIGQYLAREIAWREAQGLTPCPDWRIESVRLSCQMNFRLYHSMAVEEYPDNSEFDSIKFINPCQMTIWPYAFILL